MPDRTRLMLSLIVAAGSLTGWGCEGSVDPGPAAPIEGPDAAPERVAAVAPVPLTLSDAVVIGASVSAGYETYLAEAAPENRGGVTLARVLGAVTGDAEPRSFANVLFFMNRRTIAEAQLNSVLALQPRIVFALDYLFWHAYGAGLSDAQRVEVFERGLERLERLGDGVPIVIGDLPEMSHAIGKILSAAEVPSVEVQEALNLRLREWAAERKNVVVLPVRATVAAAMAEGRVELGSGLYEGSAARGLLTDNGLHATVSGLIALALESLRELRGAGLLEPGAAWEEDAAEVRRVLIERLGG
ncbi:MAG: SGNH/GDSL hydrolase family protein [Phycisphaerales bacterium]|nr:SGNH/GDSL hydrolase family protein [Phycisphaerales bacterium]